MILPIRYLWQQLNGPQITGICKAIEEYWKTIFDGKLDYINNISVDTANDSHLTLLGLLSGLVRPTISEPDKDFFYFTEFAENPVAHGFSDLENPTLGGGRFSKLSAGDNRHNVSLNTEHYRALLRAWNNGEGEIGSLMLLDDICAELTKLDLGDIEPFYRFYFMAGDDIPDDRAPGDVYLDMGSMENWVNPLHIYAVLNGVANSVYAPQPRIFISIGASGRVTTPVITPPGGVYDSAQEISISVSHPDNAQIYYTTDGSEPTEESTLYEEPFTISETCIVKAIAIASGYGNSIINTQAYTIE